MCIYSCNAQTTIFIIQLYFINELLRLKVLVVSLRFYLRKRCHKTSCRAEAYAYSIAKAQVATKIHTFHDDYNDHQTLAMSGRCIAAECNTTSNVGPCGLLFTIIPDLRSNWISAVNRPRSNNPSSSSLLSSKDFREDCFL